MTELKTRISEIASASTEQASGLQEVTKAMVQLEDVSQQNASVAEVSSTASEELHGESEKLEILVKDLLELMGTKPKKVRLESRPHQDDEEESDETSLRHAA